MYDGTQRHRLNSQTRPAVPCSVLLLHLRHITILLAGLVASLAIACSAGSGTGGSATTPQTQTGSAVNLPDLTDTLLLVNEDGSLFELSSAQETPLLTFQDSSFVLDPAVSPDGKYIAFGLQFPSRRLEDGSIDFGSDVYVAPTSGGQAKLVMQHEQVGEFVRSPAWLDNGKTLLVEVQGHKANGDADWYIARVDVDSGQTQRFLEDSSLPVVSPDGNDLASVHINPTTFQEDIVITHLADMTQQSLLGPDSTKILIGSLAWSPDESRLAFTAADPTVQSLAASHEATHLVSLTMHPTLQDVWMINRDGTGLKRLIDLADPRPSVVWSHDGKHVYVLGRQRPAPHRRRYAHARSAGLHRARRPDKPIAVTRPTCS